MVKTRYIASLIEDLCFPRHKMAFISGPRQCGKTTMAKNFLKERHAGQYYNWDEKSFRKQWTKNPSSIVQPPVEKNKVPLIILDEIHKAKSWKRDLKGVFDSLTEPVDIMVTGSAKLNVYRRGSDSLLGRYHHFHLHPFSLAELKSSASTPVDQLLTKIINFEKRAQTTLSEAFKNLLHFGPFPEPLFSQSDRELKLWQHERIEQLIREDLRDLSRIQELSQIEMLTSLLPERAAGVLSINALREDLEVSYPTMKLWIEYLKQLYYLFEIKPYSRSLPRSLRKEGKFYLWDWSEIENEAARFENLVASHLLKYAHYVTDSGEANLELCYLKNKEKLEIDFLLVKDKKPFLPIEIKLTNTHLSKNWEHYLQHLPCKLGLQLVQTPNVFYHQKFHHGEIIVMSAEYFLSWLV